jgi:hypothetical protein
MIQIDLIDFKKFCLFQECIKIAEVIAKILCFSWTIRFTVNLFRHLKTLYQLHIHLASTEVQKAKLT